MAYRVAIVDDSNIDAEYVQNIMKAWAQDRQAGIQAERFVSAENFLFRYADDKAWDILLLDIEMGAMDGVSLTKRIRKENELVQIVFITGFPDIMAEGYEVSALHYLSHLLSSCKFCDEIAVFHKGHLVQLGSHDELVVDEKANTTNSGTPRHSIIQKKLHKRAMTAPPSGGAAVVYRYYPV